MTDRRLLPTLIIAAAMLAGCTMSQPAARTSSSSAASQPSILPQASRHDSNKRLLLVRLVISTIEVPVGTASSSEELWAYLDEESVRSYKPGVLSLNGIRMGRGSEKSWPDVAAVLKKMTGRKMEQSSSMAVPGLPIPLLLKPNSGQQRIFTFASDRTAAGFEYPDGQDSLILSCTLNDDDPTKVLITGMPQIRVPARMPKFINNSGKIEWIGKADVFSFEQLTFQVLVPAKDFLIIGPSSEARSPNNVGHCFLTKYKNGMQFETLLVLRPEVYAAPVPAEGSPGTIAGGASPS